MEKGGQGQGWRGGARWGRVGRHDTGWGGVGRASEVGWGGVGRRGWVGWGDAVRWDGVGRCDVRWDGVGWGNATRAGNASPESGWGEATEGKGMGGGASRRGCGHVRGHPARARARACAWASSEGEGVGVGIQHGHVWKGVGMCVGTQCEFEGEGVDHEGEEHGQKC